MAKPNRVAERTVTESRGRLTTGNASVYERRGGLANTIDDCADMLTIMLRNWPQEYELPKDHEVHGLIKQMRTVASSITKAPAGEDDDILDLI